jgi:hypothetical protein
MSDKRTLTLQQADQARTDFALLESDLKFIMGQLVRLPTLSDHAALLWVELDRASEGDAKLPSARNTGSFHDQGPLELRQAGEHGGHPLAVIRGGIAPKISERAELSAGLGDDVDGVEQVEGRARESIERHNHRIAWGQGIQEPGKLRSIGPHTRNLLGEDFGAASGSSMSRPNTFDVEGGWPSPGC